MTRPADCPNCDNMPAGKACLSHTCLDCGQPTSYVHGSDGQPCPAA